MYCMMSSHGSLFQLQEEVGVHYCNISLCDLADGICSNDPVGVW